MIFIRADANREIASGHVMRCMTVADELIRRGKKVKFLISDKESETLLKKNSYEYLILDSKWNYPDDPDEIKKVRGLLTEDYKSGQKQPLLFVDSYFVSNRYFKELRPFAKLAIFDDLCSERYDVDLLINHNITYEMFDYKNIYRGKNTHLLLGTKYTPLRRQFLEYLEKQKHRQKKLEDISKKNNISNCIHVLLICGGGDLFHVLPKILNRAREETIFKDFCFHVVVGVYNTDQKEFEHYKKKCFNICFHYDVRNMAELMEKCDLAVTAAGTVLYECCAMGLPAIYFVMAENQKDEASFFARQEYGLYAGDVRFDQEVIIDRIFRYLFQLAENAELRTSISENEKKLVDGKGTKRIVNVLERDFL